MNYDEDVSIDESALDVEWLNQPRLMMKYGKMVAEAEYSMANAKQNLDIVKAGLDKKIRTKPEKYGIEKITETVVFNTILASKEYIEALEEQNTAVYEHNMAKAAVSALQHRKDALENLVRLYGQQYFAGPSIPRDLSKEWEQKKKQDDSNKRVKITRNK